VHAAIEVKFGAPWWREIFISNISLLWGENQKHVKLRKRNGTFCVWEASNSNSWRPTKHHGSTQHGTVLLKVYTGTQNRQRGQEFTLAVRGTW